MERWLNDPNVGITQADGFKCTPDTSRTHITREQASSDISALNSSSMSRGRAAAMVAISESFDLGGRPVETVDPDDFWAAEELRSLPEIHQPDDEVYNT